MDGSLGQVQAHRVLLTALVQLLDDLRVAGFFARARRRVGPFYRAVQGEGHRGRSAARVFLPVFGIFPFGFGFPFRFRFPLLRVFIFAQSTAHGESPTAQWHMGPSVSHSLSLTLVFCSLFEGVEPKGGAVISADAHTYLCFFTSLGGPSSLYSCRG